MPWWKQSVIILLTFLYESKSNKTCIGNCMYHYIDSVWRKLHACTVVLNEKNVCYMLELLYLQVMQFQITIIGDNLNYAIGMINIVRKGMWVISWSYLVPIRNWIYLIEILYTLKVNMFVVIVEKYDYSLLIYFISMVHGVKYFTLSLKVDITTNGINVVWYKWLHHM